MNLQTTLESPPESAPQPLVSVVIVSWNALETVQRCLPSVMETDYPHLEVLFVDNASSDDSVMWVKTQFPECRIVEHPENWAFCRGNNQAVPHTRGELLVFLNNDVEVPANWLQPIVEAFQRDQKLGAAQPKLHQFDDRNRFEYAGAAGGFLDRNGYPFTRGRIFDHMENDTGQYDESGEIFWATGTCLAIRSELFKELGGFEESFFMHMEEIDLCWRLRARGHTIALIPDSVVFHIGGATLAKGNNQKTYLNFRNNLLMLYRNLPPAEWKRVFTRRLVLDGIAMLRAFVSLRPGESWAILRAYASAHKMKGQFASNRPTSDEAVPLPYRGSIVMDYFVNKRRTFGQLPSDSFRL